MMKYSEITLTEDEKGILEFSKKFGCIEIKKVDMHGCFWFFDEEGSIMLWLVQLNNNFEFIKDGERYEIDKLLNPPQEPKTVWDLKKGDVFWWISSSGFIYKDRWDNSSFNIGCRNQGNVFLTEEEAKFEVRRREVCVTVKKWGKSVQEDMRIKINEYCDNDVLATEEAYANLTNDIMKEEKH